MASFGFEDRLSCDLQSKDLNSTLSSGENDVYEVIFPARLGPQGMMHLSVDAQPESIRPGQQSVPSARGF